MTTDSQGIDPYAAVLADLRAQREKIDAAIQTIESLRGSGVAPAAPAAAPPPLSPGDAVEGPGAFLGMSIPEAARKLLAARRKPLTNSDMLAAFKAGGLHLNSADPLGTFLAPSRQSPASMRIVGATGARSRRKKLLKRH